MGWIPIPLFAAREAVQVSLGFSPTELVFGHTVRGPKKAVKERFLSEDAVMDNVLDCIKLDLLQRRCFVEFRWG